MCYKRIKAPFNRTMERSIEEIDMRKIVTDIVYIKEVAGICLKLQGILSFHSA